MGPISPCISPVIEPVVILPSYRFGPAPKPDESEVFAHYTDSENYTETGNYVD